MALWNKKFTTGLQEYTCQCGFSLSSADETKFVKNKATIGNRVAEHLMFCEFKSCYFKTDEVYNEEILEENEDTNEAETQDTLEAKNVTIELGES